MVSDEAQERYVGIEIWSAVAGVSGQCPLRHVGGGQDGRTEATVEVSDLVGDLGLLARRTVSGIDGNNLWEFDSKV